MQEWWNAECKWSEACKCLLLFSDCRFHMAIFSQGPPAVIPLMVYNIEFWAKIIPSHNTLLLSEYFMVATRKKMKATSQRQRITNV